MRQTPRIILRNARRGRFGDETVLVLEMGVGGAKFEHEQRLDVGRVAPFTCGPLNAECVVRHSVLLPTDSGVVYQTGVEFPSLGAAEHTLLMDLLVHEANEQVVEWEANLSGETPVRPVRKPSRRSAVATRYRCFRFLQGRWSSKVTSDPHQPFDGITVLDDTPDPELIVLRRTYENGDDHEREFLRRVATLAILEQLRDS